MNKHILLKNDGASDQHDDITNIEKEDDGCAGGACKI